LIGDEGQLVQGGADEIQAPGEDGFHRRAALHGGPGHFFDGRERFRAAEPGKFIDALNGAQGGIAVD
jgi:hypothetical protein